MTPLSRRAFLGQSALALAAAGGRAAGPEADAFAVNRRLGRGINFGNTLEAPREGAWGLRLEPEYFDRIKEAGFNSVRIPIKWSAHAQAAPPYALDEAFARRVDWALDQAKSHGLAAVVNVHHYEQMDADPDQAQPRMVALWRQIAERYRDRPPEVVFELLNEPHDKLTDERWNEAVPPILAAVRASNPRRAVVVGPGHWNGIGSLPKLRLPDDPNLIVTVHYYSPFEFTHQGASWVKGSDKWKGRTWEGTPQQVEAVRKDLGKAAAWAAEHKRPVYLGEFGAFSGADLASRVRWTRAVAREAEKLGMSWAYWEFGSGFGAYDPRAHAWRQPLLDALLDRQG
jgi:endoglucanase